LAPTCVPKLELGNERNISKKKRRRRMKGMKLSSCLLVGLFFMLLVAPANHESAAMDKEARIVFEVG
jgi:hypothetical protein